MIANAPKYRNALHERQKGETILNCSRCNAPVPEGARFCTNCGHPQQKAPETASPSLGFPDIRIEEPRPIPMPPPISAPLPSSAAQTPHFGAPTTAGARPDAPSAGAQFAAPSGAPRPTPNPPPNAAANPAPHVQPQPPVAPATPMSPTDRPQAATPLGTAADGAPFVAAPGAPKPAPNAEPPRPVAQTEPKLSFEMPQVPEAPWATPEITFGKTPVDHSAPWGVSTAGTSGAAVPETLGEDTEQAKEDNPWATPEPPNDPPGSSSDPFTFAGSGSTFGNQPPFTALEPKPSILWLVLNSVFMVLSCCFGPMSSIVFLAGLICAAIAQSKKGTDAKNLNKASMILFFVGLGVSVLLLFVSVLGYAFSAWPSSILEGVSNDQLSLFVSFFR